MSATKSSDVPMTATRRPAEPNSTIESVPVTIVDCDVHCAPQSREELAEFLPPKWRHFEKFTPMIPFRIDHINHGSRADSRPDSFVVGRAGSDPEMMERQLLGEAEVDFAIMIYHTSEMLPNPEADAARCAAINEWMATKWLGEFNRHGRYRGSIRLPMQNPTAAFRELERWAGHPYFVQALAVHNYAPAFGHPMYEPILRATSEHRLPLAVHATTMPLNEGTPFGHPTYFFEYHSVAYVFAYAAHLASLVCNGVFERLPSLQVVMVEGGVSWSQPLADHLDRNWRLLRSEVPELTELPSHYLHRHVFWTTQPIEEPSDRRALLQVLDQLDASSRVVFATDYPHWDFDDPKRALPRMPEAMRERIMFRTACELYGLPTERAA